MFMRFNVTYLVNVPELSVEEFYSDKCTKKILSITNNYKEYIKNAIDEWCYDIEEDEFMNIINEEKSIDNL